METEKMLFLTIVSSTHSLYSLWDALSSLPLSPNDFPSSANRGEKSLSIYHLLDLLVSPSHSSLYSTLWYKRYTVTKMDIRMSITSHFIIMLPLTFPSLSSVFGMTSLRPREITKHSWRDRTKKMSRERERKRKNRENPSRICPLVHSLHSNLRWWQTLPLLSLLLECSSCYRISLNIVWF